MADSEEDSLIGVSLSSIEEPEESEGPGPDNAANLCARCRFLDFQYVGYHDSENYESNGYFMNREYAAILSNTPTCEFCRRIVTIIEQWLQQTPVERSATLDISRAGVDIRLETDWHKLKDSSKAKTEIGHSCRIRLTFSVPETQSVSETGKAQHLTFFLQKASSSSEQHNEVPYVGRSRPLKLDTKTLKGWRELCREQHGDRCSTIFKLPEKIRPRLIDVKDRCLVDAKDGDTWVCLSYVWGQAQTLRLLAQNVQELYRAGSLTSQTLPNIAEDALLVTVGLGERYLWVDALCIIQNDDHDKARFIPKMDSIYIGASVVIVAATCIDSSSFLPGVRHGTRFADPSPFPINDVDLVQCLDPVDGVDIDLRTGRSSAYLGETVWDNRAWTLQERFLASRSLVFTQEQTFWECEEAFWCEDSYREIPEILPDPHRTSLCRGELELAWNVDDPVFDHYYRTLLEEYSRRAMTNESDGLNAFLGIIRAFENSIHENFFWGLPTAYLESALAWGHHSEHKMKCRRGRFPSWSWVGWTGDGQGKLNNQNLYMEPLALVFYRFVDDGRHVQCLPQKTKHNLKYDLLAEGSNIAARGHRRTEVIFSDLPVDSLAKSDLLLTFWTACATLEVRQETPLSARSDSRDAFEWETIMMQGDREIRVSWAQMPALQNRDVLEVVAVAQNRGDWDGGHIANGAIGVMVVSWLGRLARREGFAWIAIRDWMSLSERKWRLVVLE